MQGLVPALAVAWWAPLAIIGGALVGAGVAYLLLAWTGGGRARESGASSRLRFEQAESAADLKWNPWAFLVIGGIVALVVGLSIGLSVG
jgi:hypothetical protein